MNSDAQSPAAVPAGPVKKKSAFPLALGGSLVVLAAAAGGFVWWHADRIPAPDAPATEVVRFVAEDRFKALPYAQKVAYVDRLEAMPIDQRRKLGADAGLDKDQQRAAYKNIYDQAVRIRINKYFTLKTEAERNAYLDHLIDEWQREQAFTKPEGGTGHVSADPGQIKNRLENVPPGDRANTATFIKAFMQRGILRGLGFTK